MENSTVLYYLQDITIEVRITPEVISIRDSYQVVNDDTKKLILTDILTNNNLFSTKRTVEDMFYEWKTHNVLYKWGFKQDRTKTVDFELKQSPFMKLLYKIFAKVFTHE